MIDKEKYYDLYESKNLTSEDLREIYRIITSLDNDKDFTDEQIYDYLYEALKDD